MKFFINNSIEALILFNEGDQCLLKLQVPLRGRILIILFEVKKNM